VNAVSMCDKRVSELHTSYPTRMVLKKIAYDNYIPYSKPKCQLHEFCQIKFGMIL
jgi:hypothetical protein